MHFGVFFDDLYGLIGKGKSKEISKFEPGRSSVIGLRE